MLWLHLLFQQLLFKVPHMVEEAEVFLLVQHLFVFVGLFEELAPHVLIPRLVSDEHVAATHRQAQVCFLFLSFFQGGLFCHLLKLLQPFVILFVLLLDLIPHKAHVLARPDHRKVVRGRSSAC